MRWNISCYVIEPVSEERSRGSKIVLGVRVRVSVMIRMD